MIQSICWQIVVICTQVRSADEDDDSPHLVQLIGRVKPLRPSCGVPSDTDPL